jgi:4-amino-4-deoxy-L-arabinose transferase-like glycosyltransferase
VTPIARRGWSLALAFALGKLSLHLATASGYGWFRDEFYYLACADHLALGYVDHPPLSIAVLAAARAVLGDSLVAVRSVVAVVGAVNVLVVGRITAALGGRVWAQGLAMLAIAIAPIYLALHHFYSMNAFDLLAWPLAAWALLIAVREQSPRAWVLLGVALGLGLLNKIGVLWLGAGFFAGIVATRARGQLRTRWPWIAAALALLLFAPHVWWQIDHGWPTREFIANATGGKMLEVSPVAFALGQIEAMGPATLPIWIVGLWVLLRGRHETPGRVLGIAYVFVFGLLVLSGSSRATYLAPAYGWLVPAGAVAIEGWLRRAGARVLVPVLVLAAGIVTAPFALPVLSVDRYRTYAEALGRAPTTEENKELGALPQFYADMHGWDAIVDAVERAWARVPPEQRAHTLVFTGNYGVAGAIDHLGRERGLPPAVSGHNNYHLWGTRGRSGSTLIIVGGAREDLEAVFEHVELTGHTDCGLCMPYENGNPVWIVGDHRSGESLAETWARLRHFD